MDVRYRMSGIGMWLKLPRLPQCVTAVRRTGLLCPRLLSTRDLAQGGEASCFLAALLQTLQLHMGMWCWQKQV